MKLQRYQMDIDYTDSLDRPYVDPMRAPDGYWVKHSEALDWFESLLQPVVAPAGTKHFDPFNAREISDTTAVNEKLSRLRALIAAERGKVEG